MKPLALGLAAALAAAAAGGCRGKPAEAPAGPARRVFAGEVLAVRPSADGAFLAFLHRCEPVKDRTLPPGTASCTLSVAPAGGGEAREVGRGVSTLPHGFGWSAEGHGLAALAGYDPAAAAGALVVWAGEAPRRLAEGVGFYALDRAGERAGYTAGGRLFVAPLSGGEPAEVPGGDGVATFEFGGKGGLALLARKSARAGGALLAVTGPNVRPVAERVHEYGFDAEAARFAFTHGTDGALQVADARGGPTAPLGKDVREFAFSPRGDAIAYVADARPGKQGDLWAVRLGGAAPVRVGARVGELRWSADGARLAWLQDYDPRSRTGTLAVASLGEKPAVVARNVSDFDLTGDGASVAYLVHESAGGYSVDLGLARPGAGGAPRKVERGVFGFSFSPDGAWLLYRTACIREAEACDLYRVRVAGGAPERLAEGVKSFEYAPGRPGRLLVSWARKDRQALDLALWEGGKLTALDTYARPGTVRFVGGDARRVAYAVLDPRREGVWVAEVP